MQSAMKNKIKIPSSHYYLYRNIYLYLDQTLGAGEDDILSGDLSREVLANYRNKQASLPDKKVLLDIREEVKNCQKCPLAQRRKNFVSFGTEKKQQLMILTDIPDYYDEVQGYYFSDRCRELFNNIMKAIGLDTDSLYISAAIKCVSCKALDDLTPYRVCLQYLHRELDVNDFKLIIGFGEVAFRMLFPDDDFRQHRGRITKYKGIPVIFTYHPRTMLYDTSLKQKTWQDLKPHLDFIKSLQS